MRIGIWKSIRNTLLQNGAAALYFILPGSVHIAQGGIHVLVWGLDGSVYLYCLEMAGVVNVWGQLLGSLGFKFPGLVAKNSGDENGVYCTWKY